MVPLDGGVASHPCQHLKSVSEKRESYFRRVRRRFVEKLKSAIDIIESEPSLRVKLVTSSMIASCELWSRFVRGTGSDLQGDSGYNPDYPVPNGGDEQELFLRVSRLLSGLVALPPVWALGRQAVMRMISHGAIPMCPLCGRHSLLHPFLCLGFAWLSFRSERRYQSEVLEAVLQPGARLSDFVSRYDSSTSESRRICRGAVGDLISLLALVSNVTTVGRVVSRIKASLASVDLILSRMGLVEEQFLTGRLHIVDSVISRTVGRSSIVELADGLGFSGFITFEAPRVTDESVDNMIGLFGSSARAIITFWYAYRLTRISNCHDLERVCAKITSCGSTVTPYDLTRVDVVEEEDVSDAICNVARKAFLSWGQKWQWFRDLYPSRGNPWLIGPSVRNAGHAYGTYEEERSLVAAGFAVQMLDLWGDTRTRGLGLLWQWANWRDGLDESNTQNGSLFTEAYGKFAWISNSDTSIFATLPGGTFGFSLDPEEELFGAAIVSRLTEEPQLTPYEQQMYEVLTNWGAGGLALEFEGCTCGGITRCTCEHLREAI